MPEEHEFPYDDETILGIITLLMRIDARLEILLDLLLEDDDGEEDAT